MSRIISPAETTSGFPEVDDRFSQIGNAEKAAFMSCRNCHARIRRQQGKGVCLMATHAAV
jgi:hypothetical protein